MIWNNEYVSWRSSIEYMDWNAVISIRNGVVSQQGYGLIINVSLYIDESQFIALK